MFAGIPMNIIVLQTNQLFCVILERILASGEVTLNEQRWLISLCFESSLNYQQEHLVNQVYEALRNGSLVVVDTRN